MFWLKTISVEVQNPSPIMENSNAFSLEPIFVIMYNIPKYLMDEGLGGTFIDGSMSQRACEL